MKKLLFFAGAFLLPILAAWAQTYTVTPASSTYSSAGGTATFNVSLSYPANVAAVAIAAKPPASTWTYGSATGTNIPEVRPADGGGAFTDPTDPNSVFGFGYGANQDGVIPPLSASFSFTLNYPAGLSGNQTIAFTGHYRIDGVLTNVTVSSVVLTPTPEAPTIVTQPANAAALAGANATFTVVASGVPAPSFQWQRSTDGGVNFADIANDTTFSGVTTATLTVTGVTLAMNGHRFRVKATNTQGSATSDGTATLTINAAPVITTQPRSQTLAVGTNVTFTVVATGNPAVSYQWRKGTATPTNLVNGGRISGATSASLTITGLQTGDDGAYSVVVSNGVSPNATSNNATLALLPAGFGASHSVVGAGYVAGSTLTITNTMTFTGTVTGLGWKVTLPTGWTFASSSGNYDLSPSAAQVGNLSWGWINNLTSPVTFTYTVNVPSSATGSFSLPATATVSLADASQVVMPAQPDPLSVDPVLYHSADTSHDFKIDLSELLRVISYYNTRFTNPDNTKTQTGCYKVQSGTVDGFAPDTSKSAAPAAGQGGLGAYHSADTDHNGAIDLSELLRVISYYNTRFTNPDNTKVQTGAYKVQAGTIDGYAPDPTRAP